MSQNGWLLSRRGRGLPARAGVVDTHLDSTTSRSDCRRAGGGLTATRDGGGGGGGTAAAAAAAEEEGEGERGYGVLARASVSLWDGSALAVHCSAQLPRAMHAPTASRWWVNWVNYWVNWVN
eukprot:COSAG01_NODE_24_length_37608_cov_19.303154_6_plen_122_part_00